jgi:hypothetical protein
MMHPSERISMKSRQQRPSSESPAFLRVRREKFPGVPVREIHGKRLKSLRDLPRQQQERGKLPDF